ncbi:MULTISPECIES: DUF86 domain-containing protein [unclassified Curtobacterium]|uniref:HepT-like ribonuclease domain-containing protein n=1 Tax=unclassified Curtobacterium TaxID=257496 RepID=UPI000DA967B1|nr:hypothetical protein DEJ12_08590 [Curtobacterium sp. MCLR17_059]PZF21646.1 hypothetical protein DEJ05_16285 [Curtobacterium sp. MCLR17_045]PZF48284.1 hypothetical protein DEJ10_14115 [Curtobacterium sp. MCLR17_057]
MLHSCAAIDRYVHEDSAPDAMLVDAVRMRLVEIGAAVGSLPAAVTATEPDILWARLAHIGDQVTVGGAAVSDAVLVETARTDVPRLRAAVERLSAYRAHRGD